MPNKTIEMDALTPTPLSSALASSSTTTTTSTTAPSKSKTPDTSNHSKTNEKDAAELVSQTKNKKKRGLKPRSQRNRKRPRGGVGILNFTQSHEGECTSTIEEDQEYKVQIEIRPLDLQPNENLSLSTTKKRIRIVQPYPFTYSTFAKARWNKRTILDVYSTEFGSYPKSYYENAISNGRITVSGKKVSCDYIIKGGDELSHVVHRHEPAVAICEAATDDNDNKNDVGNDHGHKKHIDIIHEDDDIIVVDKPPTVPVHPCGGYNFNSLFYILSDQNPTLEGKLHNVHRLDRLTSGLTIIAKSTNVAKVLGKCINDRDQCYKVYLARVKGKFPSHAPREKQLDLAQMVNDSNNGSGDHDASEEKGKPPIIKNGEWNIDVDESMKAGGAAEAFWITKNTDQLTPSNVTLHDVFTSRIDPKQLTHEGRSNTTDDNKPIYWLNLACPCEIICHKNGICEAGTKNGKAAQTAYAVVNYDEDTDTSIVLAKPLTG